MYKRQAEAFTLSLFSTLAAAAVITGIISWRSTVSAAFGTDLLPLLPRGSGQRALDAARAMIEQFKKDAPASTALLGLLFRLFGLIF